MQMLKYEDRFWFKYTARLYMTAGSSAKFRDSIDQLLHLLDVPDQESSDLSQKTITLRAWLTSNQDWLLLIDNIGEEEHGIILDLLLPTSEGHVIRKSQRCGAVETITAREQFCLLVVEPSVEEAMEMFFDSCENERSMENEDLVKQVVRSVGCLPHAVKQSASYVKENGMSLDEYIMRYQNAPDRVR
jgi:hypothetical protein